MIRINIRKVGQHIEIYRRLQPIARKIHLLDEAACNYELSKTQDTRLTNLLKQADDLAKLIQLRAFHQADPRGCSLYLVEKLNSATYSNYGSGIAVY